MIISLFDWQVWLVAAFGLGAIELLLGTVLLGGMAIGAFGTAFVVIFFGDRMVNAIGPDWALPIVVWAVLSLLGTAIVSAIFGRIAKQGGEDPNDAPYKGDND